MTEKKNNKLKAENIKNSNTIKTSEDFSWGGDTVTWEERAFDVASRFTSFKGEKKYSLNKSNREKMVEKLEDSKLEE